MLNVAGPSPIAWIRAQIENPGLEGAPRSQVGVRGPVDGERGVGQHVRDECLKECGLEVEEPAVALGLDYLGDGEEEACPQRLREVLGPLLLRNRDRALHQARARWRVERALALQLPREVQPRLAAYVGVGVLVDQLEAQPRDRLPRREPSEVCEESVGVLRVMRNEAADELEHLGVWLGAVEHVAKARLVLNAVRLPAERRDEQLPRASLRHGHARRRA